ncbi:hypothetical protein DFH09DRAFT_1100564 [Mycena vulgaris]|nr:hypothetical protein DFH09DRAFT_1100564 [Mycena vulgaris]
MPQPKKKTKSSKVTVEDIGDEISVIDHADAQQATSAVAVFNFLCNINNLCVGLDTFQISSNVPDNTGHRVTQSIDKAALVFLYRDKMLSGEVVAEDDKIALRLEPNVTTTWQ